MVMMEEEEGDNEYGFGGTATSNSGQTLINCCLLCNTYCAVDKRHLISSSVQASQEHVFIIKNEPEDPFLGDEGEEFQQSSFTSHSALADELLDFIDTEFAIIPRICELENKACGGGISSSSRRNSRFCQPCSARLAHLYDVHEKLKALQEEFQKLSTAIGEEFKRTYLSKKEKELKRPRQTKGHHESQPNEPRHVKPIYSSDEDESLGIDDDDDLLTRSPPDGGGLTDSELSRNWSAATSGLNIRLKPCSVVLHRLKEIKESSNNDNEPADNTDKPKCRKTKGHSYPCKFCPRIYHNIRFFRRHMKLHNGSSLAAGEKLYKCTQCPKSFGRAYILTTHLRTHTGEKPYTCQYCDKKFTTNGILAAHQITHTKVKAFGCHLCPRMFQFRSSVKRHLIKVHQQVESSFSCTKCPKNFGWECDLKRHVASKHETTVKPKPKVPAKPPDPTKPRKRRGRKPRIEFVSAKVQRVRLRGGGELAAAAGDEPRKLKQKCKLMLVYYCDECPALSFMSQETVDLHRRQEHNIGANGEGLLSCARCKSVFVNEANYNRHSVTCDEGVCVCADCGKVFESKIMERKHWRNVHLRPDSHQCEICGAAFKVKHNLELHRNTKHFGKFSFTCQQCGQLCSTKRGLNIHMVEHSGVKLVGCEHCELRFNSNLRKRRHLYVAHPDFYFADKPHGCPLCWKKFAEVEQLAEHRVEMHGKFTCSVCQKGFSSGSKFRHHMYTHTGERPYSCTLCSKTFSKNENLKDHMYRHTGERPYRCKECEAGFFRKKELGAHVQKFHSGS